MKQLYQILICDGNGLWYNENLPFNEEPTKDGITEFLKLIRPNEVCLDMSWIYKRELMEKEF